MQRFLTENNDTIDNSLKRVGLKRNERIDQKTEEVFKELLEENKEIPERQKYKIESMFRLLIAQAEATAVAKTIIEQNEVIKTSAEKSSEKRTPLDGDTIVLKQALDLKLEDLTSLDKINEAIDKMTEAIDNVMAREDINAERIEQLNERKEALEKLKERAKTEKVTTEELCSPIRMFASLHHTPTICTKSNLPSTYTPLPST